MDIIIDNTVILQLFLLLFNINIYCERVSYDYNRQKLFTRMRLKREKNIIIKEKEIII